MKLRTVSGRVEARIRVFARLLLTASFLLAMLRPAHADLIVPANAVVNLGSGVVDLACTDVIVAGSLQVASGSIVNARHVTIQAGGTIDGGSGIVELGGNWTSAGQFIAGTSQVRFRDLCGLATATIAGNTTFANASFATAIGKNYVFATGTTQTVNNRLEIAGTAALPIQFRSSTPSQVAFINLLLSGVQAIQHVGVTDVWATGQWLAPTLNNEGGGGNANRWFGGSIPVSAEPIPTLADATLLALFALLAATGALLLRRRQVAPRNSKRPRISRAP